jgi:hypothetical protein
MSDQIVILHHFFHGICQRKCDGERKAFWDGNNEDGDANDQKFEEIFQIGQTKRLLIDHVMGDAEPDEQNKHSANCKDKT